MRKSSRSIRNSAQPFNELEKAADLAQRARDLLPQDPRTADTLGWILYHQHQYTRALSLFRESSDKLPADAEIQFHLGMTHYQMGAEDQARQALARALELAKDVPWAEEARQHLSILGIDVAAAGAAGRSLLEAAMARNPRDPMVLVRLASLYARDGDAGKAISTYESVLSANPGNVPALLGLGRQYASQGNLPKALEITKTAHDLAPDDPGVTHALGFLAFQTGDFPWAASLLDTAARSRPDDPEVLFDFANAAYSVGRVPDAEAAMQHALQTSPSFPRAAAAARFLKMTALSDDPKQAPGAVESIGQVLKSDPADVPARMALAAADEQRSDPAAAKEAYETVLSHFPEFAPAQRRFAILEAENPTDQKKAYERVVKARQFFPDDPDLARAFGIIVYRQGDFSRAASLLKECSQRNGDDAEVMYYLGMAQHGLNQSAASKESLKRALALNLRNDLAADARRTLAELK
jgi:tetratricopeptide (TPR) repeat protein